MEKSNGTIYNMKNKRKKIKGEGNSKYDK